MDYTVGCGVVERVYKRTALWGSRADVRAVVVKSAAATVESDDVSEFSSVSRYQDSESPLDNGNQKSFSKPSAA